MLDPITKYILEKEDLEEGLIRGLSSEFKDIGDDLGAIIDMFSTKQESVVPRVKYVLGKLKRALSKIEIRDPRKKSHNLLKFRQAFARWRFYFYMNDKVYKEMIKQTLKTGKDASGYVDISTRDRVIPALYNAKSTRDLIKLTEEYEKRIEHVYGLVKSNPQNKGLRGFLRQGLYGLRDWVIAVRRLASYWA